MSVRSYQSWMFEIQAESTRSWPKHLVSILFCELWFQYKYTMAVRVEKLTSWELNGVEGATEGDIRKRWSLAEFEDG